MKKIISSLIFVVFLQLFFPTNVFANSNFSTSYNATYSVDQDALTHVTYNIQLENLTKTFFASSYDLNVGFKNIQNIQVSDNQSEAIVNVSKTSSGNNIIIKFKTRIVGLDKLVKFSLSFDTKDIAQNLNNVWDINIPGISDENDYSSFNVTVDYPKGLGIPTYIKPSTEKLATDSGKLQFSKKDLNGSGISISFGKFQIYNLDLKYHLKNGSVFSVTKTITLPPDSNYQTVQYDNILPKPVNITKDEDGNWLAEYKLAPMQEINVEVVGKVKVELTPKQEDINQQLKSDYLMPQKFWESGNNQIISLAQKLKTPEAIYNYVVKTLNYDYSRSDGGAKRLGSVAVLKNPDQAVCLEFTDLFISIARAAGIPAREVDGYAYTGNNLNRPSSLVKDILHAWPEYYDFNKKQWIMVDPTWGNTTAGVDYFKVLDFDHIAFVIKGENSENPIPAGGYKLNQKTYTKDIQVSIGSNFKNHQQTDLKSASSNIFISGLPIKIKINIINNGNQAIENELLTVNTSLLNPTSQSLLSDLILPYGNETVEFNYKPVNFLTNTTDTIKITVDGNHIRLK